MIHHSSKAGKTFVWERALVTESKLTTTSRLNERGGETILSRNLNRKLSEFRVEVNLTNSSPIGLGVRVHLLENQPRNTDLRPIIVSGSNSARNPERNSPQENNGPFIGGPESSNPGIRLLAEPPSQPESRQITGIFRAFSPTAGKSVPLGPNRGRPHQLPSFERVQLSRFKF